MTAAQFNVTKPGVVNANPDAHRREIATAVNRLIDKLSIVGTVTLTASAASTAISDARISSDSLLFLTPKTANAAAEVGNGTMYYTGSAGAVTITHANNAQTDRTYAYFVLTP